MATVVFFTPGGEGPDMLSICAAFIQPFYVCGRKGYNRFAKQEGEGSNTFSLFLESLRPTESHAM